MRILEGLVEAHPECDEARAFLRDYRGVDVVPATTTPAQLGEMPRRTRPTVTVRDERYPRTGLVSSSGLHGGPELVR